MEALMLSEAKGASLGHVTWRLDVSSSLILPQASDSQSLWVPGRGGSGPSPPLTSSVTSRKSVSFTL